MRDDIVTYIDAWHAAGVTDAVGDGPANWFALVDQRRATLKSADAKPAAPPAELRRAPASVSPVVRPAVAPTAASAQAHATAAAAQSLDDLLRQIEAFEGCGLKATAKSLCFYRGAPKARLMLIGEAPGRDEDIAGKPFVGRAGQLLDKMLAAIGIDESKVHITNTVYWRPPGNRTPTPEETQACAPFVTRQIELVEPDVIVLLGGVAAKSVLGLTEGILKLRGKWRALSVAGREVRSLATLHPAYLLRTPAAKRQVWQDLQLIAAALAT